MLATRMPSFGRLQEFDLDGGEDLGQYTERRSHYFTANEIADAGKKKAILLTACGSATYKLMCDLVAPAKPGDKTFDDRLICWISNDRIQRRLLAEKDLTFDKALEVATAMEMAEKSAADLQGKAAMDTERSTVSMEKVTTELEGVNLVT